MQHIIMWSGGKDSTATVLLFHQHESELLKEGDTVVINFVEIMFDLKNNISGHNPESVQFIYDTKKVFESWGYTVNILHADKDFLTRFNEPLTRCKNPEDNGLKRGFPVSGGRCWVQRDLKMKPLIMYKKSLKSEDVIEYVGIAVDEPERYASLTNNSHTATSLLVRYGLTEQDAKNLCRKNNMLSPHYQLNDGKQRRDGCWFCPHAKLCEHEAIRKSNPSAWEKYVSLENEPDLGYKHWNIYSGETLHNRDWKLRHAGEQLNMFDLLDS